MSYSVLGLMEGSDVIVSGTSEVTVLSSGWIDLVEDGPLGLLKFWAAGHTDRSSSTSSSLTFRIRQDREGSLRTISSFGVTSTSTASGISFTVDAWAGSKTSETPNEGKITITGGMSVHTGLTTGVAGDGYIQRFTNAPSPTIDDPSSSIRYLLTVQPSNSNFQAIFRGGIVDRARSDV